MAENREKETTEFVDHVISIRRVTKVTKGGKRFSFSVFVVSGNKEGVGIALGKSREVSLAIAKATARARKNLIVICRRDTTIPYAVEGRHGATKVVIRPAYKGTGKVAGGAVRAILDAAGIEDALTKAIGSGNGQNVAKAALNALSKLRSAHHIARLRGKTVQEIIQGS